MGRPFLRTAIWFTTITCILGTAAWAGMHHY